jgi:hypothetical protein
VDCKQKVSYEEKFLRKNMAERLGLCVYSHVLISLMPEFKRLPKRERIYWRKQTQAFLEHLYPKPLEFSQRCKISFVFKGMVQSTLGIHPDFESKYKLWAVKQMRTKYGALRVPLQKWELVQYE